MIYHFFIKKDQRLFISEKGMKAPLQKILDTLQNGIRKIIR